MKMRLVLALSGLVAIRMVVQGQITNSIIVNYNGGSGLPNMVDSTGAPLPNTDPTAGLTVEIGYFNSGFDIGSNASDLGALSQNWHQFGPGTSIQTNAFAPQPGSFGSTSQQSQVFDPAAGPFGGKQIDLWVFKTSDGLTPHFGPGDNGNVLEYGLYTELLTLNPSTGKPLWTFPNSGPPTGGNETSIDTSQVDTIYWGYETQSGGNVISLGLLPVTAVPEPGPLALFGFGLVLVGVVSHRLRRH